MPTKPTVLRYRARTSSVLKGAERHSRSIAFVSCRCSQNAVGFGPSCSRRRRSLVEQVFRFDSSPNCQLLLLLVSPVLLPILWASFASQYLPLFCDLSSMGVLFLGGCDSDALHLSLVFALFVTRTVSCFRSLLLFDWSLNAKKRRRLWEICSRVFPGS
jgi:hypothetical protein